MLRSNPFSFVLGRRTTAPIRDVEMNDGPDDSQDDEMEDMYQEAQTKPGAKQHPDVEATDVRPIHDHPLRNS
jgi:hypothetical protein